MRKLLSAAALLVVLSSIALAGDVPIPPKCDTCSTAQQHIGTNAPIPDAVYAMLIKILIG
jgi:hypothetical protein